MFRCASSRSAGQRTGQCTRISRDSVRPSSTWGNSSACALPSCPRTAQLPVHCPTAAPIKSGWPLLLHNDWPLFLHSDCCCYRCGDCCQSARFFAACGARVTAMDCSQSACEAARGLCASLQAAVCVVRGDICLLPFRSESFDLVSFFYSMHHVAAHHTTDLLEAACRLLAPGGWLAIAALADGSADGESCGATEPPAPFFGVGQPQQHPVLSKELHPILKQMHKSFCNPVQLCELLEQLGLTRVQCTFRTHVYENEFPCIRVYILAHKSASTFR